MDRGDPSRLQYSQEFGRKIIHLHKEALKILIVSEIVVAIGIFIMIPEWYRRMNKTDRIRFHCPGILYTVIVYRFVMLSFDLHRIHPHLSFQPLELIRRIEPIFFHNLDHLLDHAVVVSPLLFQSRFDLPFRLHVNDVYYHLILLQESVAPVDCLYKIIEFSII